MLQSSLKGQMFNSLFLLAGLSIPHHLQVLIALRYMATGNTQVTISDRFDVPQGCVLSCISQVSRAVAMLGRDVIKMPTRNASLDVMLEFKNKTKMPGIVGCIGCTHVSIAEPPRDQVEVFKNRKGTFSLNVQAVCGPQLQFYNIVARWPGSVHKCHIFDNSRLCAEMEKGVHRGCLLGDSAYSCRRFLFTPLSQPETKQEHGYNTCHTAARSTIRKALALLKKRFSCLANTMTVSLENTKAIIVAAAVLHNVAVLKDVPLPDEDNKGSGKEDEEEDSELLLEDGDLEEHEHDKVEGDTARQHYIVNHF